MKKEIKLFATWKYDSFPYFLGGEVIELLEDGFCTVKGYSNMRFKHLTLMPLEEGLIKYKRAMEISDDLTSKIASLRTNARMEIGGLGFQL